MMIEPECFNRKCKHYQGVKQLDENEGSQINVCAAFPDGIPVEIIVGEDLHLTPRKDQGNEIVYEKSDK